MESKDLKLVSKKFLILSAIFLVITIVLEGAFIAFFDESISSFFSSIKEGFGGSVLALLFGGGLGIIYSMFVMIFGFVFPILTNFWILVFSGIYRRLLFFNIRRWKSY